MNIHSTARAIFYAIKDDASIIAELRAEHKKLAKDIALDPQKSGSITSATVNGQSFSKSVDITHGQRLTMLGMVIGMIDGSVSKSSQIRPSF